MTSSQLENSAKEPANNLKYRILGAENLIVCQAYGELGADNLNQHIQALFADKDYRHGINGLYDFTHVSNIVGCPELGKAIAARMLDEGLIAARAKVAILSSSKSRELQCMLDDYVQMTSESWIDFRLFREEDWEQALHYVGYESQKANVKSLMAFLQFYGN